MAMAKFTGRGIFEAADFWLLSWLCDGSGQHRDNPVARARLGYHLNSLGKPDEAIQELRAALKLDLNSDVAHFQLARIYDSRKQYEDAISEYRETVRINHGNDARGDLAQAVSQGCRYHAESLLFSLLPRTWANRCR